MMTFNNWLSTARPDPYRHRPRARPVLDAVRATTDFPQIENREQLLEHLPAWPEEDVNDVWQLYVDARIEDAGRRFARANGWRPARKDFSFAQLAGLRQRRGIFTIGDDYWHSPQWHNSGHGVLDHLYWFRADRKPAAIVTMPYPDEFAAARWLAGRYELDVQAAPKPKSGWWFPGHTQLYVFVQRGVTVNWLPEQHHARV